MKLILNNVKISINVFKGNGEVRTFYSPAEKEDVGAVSTEERGQPRGHCGGG